MYATEYDLMVASDRLRDRRDEMRAIRLARTAKAEALVRPSLLDRLIALTSRGAQVQAPHRKIGAAA